MIMATKMPSIIVISLWVMLLFTVLSFANVMPELKTRFFELISIVWQIFCSLLNIDFFGSYN
jgi:hypothetical protein